MCYSAPASYTTGAILLPVAMQTIRLSWKYERSHIVLSSFPLLFGLQQIVEGMVWNSLNRGISDALHLASLVYLFFAFGLWPALTPIACYYAEPTDSKRKPWMFLLSFIGILVGGLIYVPLLQGGVDFSTTVVRHSILYETSRSPLIKDLYTVLYVLTVVFSFFFSSRPQVRIFGGIIAVSVFISFLFFRHAFFSVWCFFAAILSTYILYILVQFQRSHVPESPGKKAA